jgi:type I restriction enzyme M protein
MSTRRQHQPQTPTLFKVEDEHSLQRLERPYSVSDGQQHTVRGSTLLRQSNLYPIQRRFDELHEEIYKKGGIKPTNAAIDEVGKLIFLKIHKEKNPDYQLQQGVGASKRFVNIFRATYIRQYGKQAVRELQDAFQEISTLPCYTARGTDGERQTLFPYQEPLRLDHPDVLAMAIETLSALSLTVPDDSLSGNKQEQWEAFSHQDLLGCAYDVFLRGKYDSAGGLGTYLTPSQVVDCMVKMAFHHLPDHQLWARRGDPSERARWQPKSGEEDLPAFLMGDICCGTGRFLVRTLAEVRQRVLDAPGKDEKEKLEWLALMKRYSFFGADQAASSIVKARINFLMFGETHAPLLTVEDSILDEQIDRLAEKFDLILTNPPFGEGKYETQEGLAKMRRHDLGLHLGWSWKAGEKAKKPLRRADPALLFLDRNLQLLKPNGLLLIVLPDGLLEPAYAYAHRYLLGKATLRAVVSLPKDTFAISGTVAKTSFICLQKTNDESETRGPIFMAMANHVGYVKKGTVEVPDPHGDDLPAIATAYETPAREERVEAPRELSHDPMIVLLPRGALRDALTPHTYHPDRLRAEKSVSAMEEEARSLHDVASLAQPRLAKRTERTGYFISVLHVDDKSNVDWDAAASHAPSSKGLRCRPNDIIFSCLNPSKIRVTVIPHNVEGEVLCSTEFAVLHAREGEDPYFIALALKAKTSQRQIVPLARGTSSSRRRVREQDLLNIIIPYPEVTIRQRVATQFRQALNRARTALVLNCESLFALDHYVQTNTAMR